MISYLQHSEIDKSKWDETVSRSVNGIIYARSWYLDIVSPGWDALVEDDYKAVFPLTHNRKFGVGYLYQPFFTQQLGLFTRDHLTEKLVNDFLQSIPPKFRFAEIHLNSMNKVDPGCYSVESRINLELDLIDTYENLRRNYDQNAKRNLKKAFDSGIAIRHKVEPDELITLFRENYGKKEGKLKFKDYEVIRKLMVYCLKKRYGLILGAFLPDGKLCAAVFFLLDQNRLIFHFAASTKNARDTGAMFFLVDSFIREQSEKTMTLDFEGSNDTNVARFYKSFGARECNYYMIRINRLPWIARKAVYFKKRIR
jgi:hypothetical protein